MVTWIFHPILRVEPGKSRLLHLVGNYHAIKVMLLLFSLCCKAKENQQLVPNTKRLAGLNMTFYFLF